MVKAETTLINAILILNVMKLTNIKMKKILDFIFSEIFCRLISASSLV